MVSKTGADRQKEYYDNGQAVKLSNRAGPQSQKWSDQQITLNPTGSIHRVVLAVWGVPEMAIRLPESKL